MRLMTSVSRVIQPQSTDARLKPRLSAAICQGPDLPQAISTKLSALLQSNGRHYLFD
jgi:hypothetical protein